jgi:uncharacterized protein (TIGR03083 family)
MVGPVRSVFLEALQSFVDVSGSDVVAARWSDPTVVPPYLVGELVGHILSTAAATERYLDAELPTEPPVPAAGYYVGALPQQDAADVHAGIRGRGAKLSERGSAALTVEAATLHERLSARLESEPAERVVEVMGGTVLTLDGYLRTRIVELVVHLDDLAASLGADFELADDAVAIAVSYLVDICRARNGDLAVLRALARQERGDISVLRAL